MAERTSSKKERFEDHLKVVEEAIRGLESGNLDLEESLTRYEKGVASLKKCYELLAQAERRLEKLRQEQPLPGADGEDPIQTGDTTTS